MLLPESSRLENYALRIRLLTYLCHKAVSYALGSRKEAHHGRKGNSRRPRTARDEIDLR